MLAAIIIGAVLVGVVALGGGNTVDGFGRDLQNTGRTIQENTHNH